MFLIESIEHGDLVAERIVREESLLHLSGIVLDDRVQIGRASCRERVLVQV